MPQPNAPSRNPPSKSWAPYAVWERVNALFYSMPNHFKTELVIKGINATEIFSVGSAFSTVVDSQVVTILNDLRSAWDPDNRYTRYAFVRQSQNFPDVLLRNQENPENILFGIELKSWYVLSKEGEPSFRYQITPEACASADLIVVIPWLLSDVISGTPRVLTPYVELAAYAADYRNFYWQQSRTLREGKAGIRKPPAENLHPYPSSKQEASDEAEGDKGGNFGRIARAGILDEFVNHTKQQTYLGVKLAHWITFFKAISENTADAEIERRLQALRSQIQSESLSNREQLTEAQEAILEIIQRLEQLTKTVK
jgi:hypothetical protein